MRTRTLYFGTVISAIVVGAAWFAASTWVRFSGEGSVAWKIGASLLVGAFIPTTILSFSRGHPLLRALAMVSSSALGVLNYALFAAAACWIVHGAAALAGMPLDMRRTAFALFGGAVFAAVYGLANAARLRVTRVTVSLPDLPPSWDGLELALVSDIHLGNIRGRRFVRRIVARLNELKPEAVFVTGDMFDGAKIDLDRVVRPWADLKAASGAYFVSGNHDEFSEDRAPFLAAIEGAGLRVLRNEKVTVRGLQVIGVLDRETQDGETFRAILRRAQIDPRRPSILLAHRPSNLNVPEKEGISLQLSGHTHSGQFWPWNRVVSRVHGRFSYGLNRLGNLQVFTSSGAGTWGPPMRVGTKSEIVLLRLAAAPMSISTHFENR